MIIGLSNGAVKAGAASLGAINAQLDAASVANNAVGALVTPPGNEGASAVATLQQKESLALFAGYLKMGLLNIADLQAHTNKSEAALTALDAVNGASIAGASLT